MSKDRVASTGMWFGELFHIGVYKRSQGRVTRQATFAALAVIVALGAWSFYTYFGPSLRAGLSYSVAGGILLIGLWLAYRIVNVPRFADFLIAVEAEMNKVSWPSRTELYRSSVVVIFVMLAMAAMLFGFDILWMRLFEWMGILR